MWAVPVCWRCLIWSNLKRKKVRTFLTFSSIVVAFVLFGYLAAIREGFAFGVSDDACSITFGVL